MDENKGKEKKTKTWHGILFAEIDHFFSNFKYFFHFHENMFEIIFLMVYLIEQFSLLYFFYFGEYDVQMVIGFFTLLLLFTISFEKILLKMRNNKIAEEKNEMEIARYLEYVTFKEEYEKVKEEAERANKYISEIIQKYNILFKEHEKLKRIKIK